jgi:hypothetical protein
MRPTNAAPSTSIIANRWPAFQAKMAARESKFGKTENDLFKKLTTNKIAE